MMRSLANITYAAMFILVTLSTNCSPKIAVENQASETKGGPPNFLFAISDDQSYPYTTAYGDRTTLTPAFDALAKRGVLFTNAFCAAPQCSPSRAAILTGKNIWELEEAGTHSSLFPKKFPVITQVLAQSGYQLGFTGKPWGPGNWKDSGWKQNPVGPEFNSERLDPPYQGISNKDYAKNFSLFLKQRDESRPFFFWYGGHEPHRSFEFGSGVKAGKNPDEAIVPPFLPEDDIVRQDIIDHSVEIEWFDQHLGKMLEMLSNLGELENTVVVVTADNGMAFPYAKANLQEFGTHVPLVMAGPQIKKNRRSADLVSLIDLAPTFADLAGTEMPGKISGRSLSNILSSAVEGISDPSRTYVVTGRERHTHARPNNFGYPARAIRTQQYLYIHNFKPDRWPAGDPEVLFPEGHKPPDGFKSMKDGYHDIDACPTKTLLLEQQEKYESFFFLAVAKRPREELYDMTTDPGCLHNLSNRNEFASVRTKMKNQLFKVLRNQQDPRIIGNGNIFESYPRFAGMREFPGFKKRGAYNPRFQE